MEIWQKTKLKFDKQDLRLETVYGTQKQIWALFKNINNFEIFFYSFFKDLIKRGDSKIQ